MTPEHDCIQEKRLQRLEGRTDKLEDKIDKILDKTSKNGETLVAILTRLDKKKEHDIKVNGVMEKEESRIDTLENNYTALNMNVNNNKQLLEWVISLLKAMSVGFVLFFITFIVKTFIWGY